jgi:hypothetical protein
LEANGDVNTVEGVMVEGIAVAACSATGSLLQPTSMIENTISGIKKLVSFIVCFGLGGATNDMPSQ